VFFRCKVRALLVGVPFFSLFGLLLVGVGIVVEKVIFAFQYGVVIRTVTIAQC
jgi:hypothetical protein